MTMADKPDLQELFLKTWWEDFQVGITPRATYDLLREHLKSDEVLQRDMVERLSKLEANMERDAEDRGTGRHFIPTNYMPSVSAVSKRPSGRPWWKAIDDKTLRIILLLLAAAGGWLARHIGIKP